MIKLKFCHIDPRIEKKEKDKVKNYTNLKYEILKNMRS